MSKKEQPNYYAIIPATVRYDTNLKYTEKLLYGEITALSNKNGYCYAQNKYFADLYNVTAVSVSRWISHLQQLGYIKTEVIRNENKELAEENSNKNTTLASTQRDYIAGEVSRDLTKRMLLPEKISKANEEGILNFHNSDYFIQPIINYCVTDVKEMLYNGTIINGVEIEEPKTFERACNILTQIIAQVESNIYGKQYIDLSCLGKFLRKSKEEFKSCCKRINRTICKKRASKRICFQPRYTLATTI